MTFPALLDRQEIGRRLRVIFPEGTPNRDKCIRDAATATVAAFLYVGAIEGQERWLNPVHVVRMSDDRMNLDAEADRLTYGKAPRAIGIRWYEENSREQVRDEVIRYGLYPNGAVLERPGISTTSSTPRYCLKASFARLFDPSLVGDSFDQAAAAWGQENLSAAALGRISSFRAGADFAADGVLVRFPNGEARMLAPGPSSAITKAVIEVFAPTFLKKPAVVWLSESAAKVHPQDMTMMKRMRLSIAADRVLPDIILVDLGEGNKDFRLVFVEVVASDGPVTEQRAQAFRDMAAEGGYGTESLMFVTAFLDRDRAEVKKAFPTLAWGSTAWFVSEPENLIRLQ